MTASNRPIHLQGESAEPCNIPKTGRFAYPIFQQCLRDRFPSFYWILDPFSIVYAAIADQQRFCGK